MCTENYNYDYYNIILMINIIMAAIYSSVVAIVLLLLLVHLQLKLTFTLFLFLPHVSMSIHLCHGDTVE